MLTRLRRDPSTAAKRWGKSSWTRHIRDLSFASCELSADFAFHRAKRDVSVRQAHRVHLLTVNDSTATRHLPESARSFCTRLGAPGLDGDREFGSTIQNDRRQKRESRAEPHARIIVKEPNII